MASAFAGARKNRLDLSGIRTRADGVDAPQRP
jgi:hypothetical protein